MMLSNIRLSRVDKIATVILFIICIIIFIFRFVAHPVYVLGESMYPTYESGDILTTDTKFTPEDIHYDSIIAFKGENTGSHAFIKRVVGMPGDTVQIKDYVLYINDIPENRNFTMSTEFMDMVTVPEGEYYVLGDNRDHSRDSRDIGTVKFEEITNLIHTDGPKINLQI